MQSIPAKTRLFLSTISANDERLSADWQRHKLPLLTEKSARKDLVTEYFIILEELRIFGEFDKLEKHLEGYLQTETIPALYEKVLARFV
ncbi:MAG: hypothetical protein ABFS56_30830 [Pseudomonadota bacterium]